MGVVQAFVGAIGGTFADQWKDIITAGHFDEYTVVAPGVHQQVNRGRGSNTRGSVDVISNGSKIFIPENTAAFIFSQAGIQDVIWQPGGYEFHAGMPSVFAGDGVWHSVAEQAAGRFGFGGLPYQQNYIAFVNLREIRGVKFGTPQPVVYHDRFYGTDLEVLARGTYSLQVVDPVLFVRHFLPANTRYYSFASPEARQQLTSEFLQAFIVALNSLSSHLRISELPQRAAEIADELARDDGPLGTWIRRFGIDLARVGIESIAFSAESRELVKQYSAQKMNVSAFESVSQRASSIAAQQKIAGGVQEHGLGDGGGMLFGMNLAQSMNPQNAAPTGEAAAAPTLDAQLETVKKLKELLDAGVLTEDEFLAKKREVLGL